MDDRTQEEKDQRKKSRHEKRMARMARKTLENSQNISVTIEEGVIISSNKKDEESLTYQGISDGFHTNIKTQYHNSCPHYSPQTIAQTLKSVPPSNQPFTNMMSNMNIGTDDNTFLNKANQSRPGSYDIPPSPQYFQQTMKQAPPINSQIYRPQQNQYQMGNQNQVSQYQMGNQNQMGNQQMGNQQMGNQQMGNPPQLSQSYAKPLSLPSTQSYITSNHRQDGIQGVSLFTKR
jgi:hypothetical protein